MAGHEGETRTPIQISGPVGNLSGGSGNDIADVIAVEIQLNVFILSGNLKSVAKPLFTVGTMTAEYISVIKTFQKQIVGFSYPDGRVDPGGKTFKFLNGPLGARGGKVGPAAPGLLPDIVEARRKIAETAVKYVNELGHFLMGSQGDMPGVANGHPLRPTSTFPSIFLDPTHKLGPAVNAARRVDGKYGCMGRPSMHTRMRNYKIVPGDPRMKIVDGYVKFIARAKAAGISHLNWPGFDWYEAAQSAFDSAISEADMRKLCVFSAKGARFPRRIATGPYVYLGESCHGRRHYDCIGFVNFVLSKILRSNWRAEMSYYQNEKNGTFDVTDLSGHKDDVLSLAREGDIVLKSSEEKHCGICVPHKSAIWVANCRSMADGLLLSRLTAEWSYLARLKSLKSV